jgi:hypothetical protein
MADTSARNRVSRAVDRWWLLPLGVLVVLLGVAVALVISAQYAYDRDEPSDFSSVVATDVLLSGAVVITLGSIISTVLSLASGLRAQRERAADKRLDLFLRMRNAHVRVALAQQVLKAEQDAQTYHKQMHHLLPVIKDMEEIREEVRVSGRLYEEEDRRSIIEGIALIIEYLQAGFAQYVVWSNPEGDGGPTLRPAGGWIVELVEGDHGVGRPAYRPEHEDWEPIERMPPEYDDGLERSKLIMRAYVYGFSRTEMTRLRTKIQQDRHARRGTKRGHIASDAGDSGPRS